MVKMMALTRSFKETIKARADRDADFRKALYEEALNALLKGDADTCKALLRDFVNASIGFARLEEMTGTSSKSLMRMLGPKGNPGLGKLLPVIQAINTSENVRPEVRVA